MDGACNTVATAKNCDLYYHRWGFPVNDARLQKNSVATATKTDNKVNATTELPSFIAGWIVSHDTTASTNAKATTLDKVAGGKALSQDWNMIKQAKDKFSQKIESVSRMAKADALVGTSSVTTYGFTVQSFSVAEMNTEYSNMSIFKQTSEKVLRVHTLGMLPEVACISEAGAFVVSAAGAVTKKGNTAQVVPFVLATGADFEGEGNGLFSNLNTDIRSELTGPTVDADNKNERFSSSVYLWNLSNLDANLAPTQTVRLSQAFILQTDAKD